MVEEFKTLRDDEIEVLLNAPVLVSVMIAGADDKIDKTEITQAVEIANSKQARAREQLIEYYREVGKDFQAKFEKYVAELPDNASARTDLISTELRKLNHILPKLEHNFAVKLYASLKEMAKKVAEASGGVLGYMSVSYEEAKLMELGMIEDPDTFEQ
ncbi:MULTISPECIES: hypothetical protein [Reichenbachiella]|uniref:Uncharacterized protein n=1 Tax=Reichenbachiella agariperforans TaxID=156994 RepID=A0A1M6J5X1_REIAG|nr:MULTISPECIES: hypothetical protein [Reichenbachiella]MBU2913073.1 hypothetical protein [Reichenbachiella agariperforans]RJE74923.1 hypothetical protein BGP76_17530 [Reichenbachiella sp. MSK19-1]SHJ42062.1 hypothetical protein SAMN04488028_10155 [Reichenbachiella agariperforans]